MGKFGPKPTGKLTVIEKTEVRSPNPLQGMTDSARTIWKRIVSVYPGDYFKPQHYDQLRAYCEAAAMYKKAVDEIKREGATITQVNGVVKRNPWCLERDACAQVMAQLGTKLSINKNATAAGRRKDAEGEIKKPSRRDGLLFNE